MYQSPWLTVSIRSPALEVKDGEGCATTNPVIPGIGPVPAGTDGSAKADLRVVAHLHGLERVRTSVMRKQGFLVYAWCPRLSKSQVVFPQTVYCWGSILERKGLATLTGRAPEICGWALWPCPPPVNSVAGLCGWALFSSWPRPCTLSSLRLGSVAGPCPPLVLLLLLAAPLKSVNSVAGCGWALSSSCPPLGRAPALCQLCGWALSSEVCQLCGSVAEPCPPLVLLIWPRP